MNQISQTVKTQPTENVKKIKVGEKDITGNKITDVLATNNEFAIYEIEHHDVNSKIKVLIDGVTDESEKEIQLRFMSVKQKYIEAKGLLSRSENYGMMKQRIAHTLATCLYTDGINGNNEFEELIKTIKKEHNEFVKNRFHYLIPCLIGVLTLFIAATYLSISKDNNNLSWNIAWNITTALLSASLGGCVSMLITAKSLNFEEISSRSHYFMLGLERLVLACVAGSIAYIVIKSEIAFPSISKSNHWAFMTVLVISGFSESFIPSILSNIKSKNS